MAWHAPPPSHRAAKVSVPATHDPGRHTVLAGYLRQAPAPSHVPSRPQDAEPSSAHSPRGSVPGAAGTQVPARSGMAQDMQVPEQALSQQSPSTQNPLSHWAAAVHGAPFGVGPGLAPPSTPPITLEIGRSAPLSGTLSASAPPHAASASTADKRSIRERLWG